MDGQPTRADASDGGFTLLEVVVALTLLGLLYAAAFSVFAAGMKSSRAASQYTTAVLEGERILNEVLAKGVQPEVREGVLATGYRWRAETSRDAPKAEGDPAQLLRVRVSVWWPSLRGEQQFELVTLAMAP